MLAKLKKVVFYLAKYTGGFYVTRRLYRKRIRFLCYHGFTLEDESNFLPKLFIDLETFSKRMHFLKEKGYNVITLDKAVEALRTGQITDDSVVLTIDDGFYGVYAKAVPTLHQLGFPATLYLTSYYFDRGSPIFSLAVRYFFWSANDMDANLTTLKIPGLDEVLSKDNRLSCIDLIVEFGQSRESNEERVLLLRQLGELLNVDYDRLNESRVMGLINVKELQQLLRMNVDIQMHTHRHNFPLELEEADYELSKNRETIDPLLSVPMRHFCYPSGLWNEAQWRLLRSHGIVSATTCLPGLADKRTNLYAIPRFLDGANISQIEYESELAGFSELCRKFKLRSQATATQ